MIEFNDIPKILQKEDGVTCPCTFILDIEGYYIITGISRHRLVSFSIDLWNPVLPGISALDKKAVTVIFSILVETDIRSPFFEGFNISEAKDGIFTYLGELKIAIQDEATE